jgi:hypothetical protein
MSTQRQPCGRPDCCAEFNFAPRIEAAYAPTAAELANDFDPAGLVQHYVDLDRHVAMHEAGHCVSALAFEVAVKHIVCGDRAGHCSYASPLLGEAKLIATLGGPVAEGLSRGCFPSAYHAAAAYFAKAKQGRGGACDGCSVARLIVQTRWPDAELIASWRRWWSKTVRLLDHLSARIALANVAAALRDQRYLTGEQGRQARQRDGAA